VSGRVFVLVVLTLPLSTTFLLDFGTVPTVSYYFSLYYVLFRYFYIDISEGCTFTITIKGEAGCENQIKQNAMGMEAIMVREFGAILTHITDGSVVIHLKSVDGDIIARLTDSIRRGQFVRLIEELFSCHEANSSIPSGDWSVEFIIELDNSSSKMKCK
jgi:hypothetical protein